MPGLRHIVHSFRPHQRLSLALLGLGLAVHLGLLRAVPSGISGDSARLGLHALDFLRRGVWPFYVYHLFAPNPLIVYLDAVTLALFGASFMALCSIPALSAALAAPAIYLAGREVLADHGPAFAHRAGLLAALGLTLSTVFHALVPYGTEHSLLPLLELLAVAALWRGLRRGRRADFLMAGLLIGVSQYAYIVARAFPPALAGAMLCALILRREWLRRWRRFGLTALAAAAVALPQWVVFVRTPYAFLARSEQAAGRFVFGLPNAPAIVLSKLANQVLMLGWRWDNSPHFGRPLLDPVLTVGLLAAVIVTLRRRRASLIFLAALAAFMLLPDLVTYETLSPSATRIVGAVPMLILLAGAGGAAIWQWLENRPRLPRWAGALVLAGVILSGAERQWDYVFRLGPQRLALPGYEWSASLVEMAEADFINRQPEVPILIPASEYQRPPLAYLLADRFPERRGALAAPLAIGAPVVVVAPAAPDRPTSDGIASGYRPDEWVLLDHGAAYFLPPLPGAVGPAADGATHELRARNGALAAQAFPARWLGGPASMEALGAAFVNGLELAGYHRTELSPGQPLTVTLYWRPRQAIADDEQIFVQVLDRSGNAIAAVHDWPLHGVYRVAAWRAGELMPLTYSLGVPSTARPGAYRLVAGEWDVLRQARVLLATGEDVATVAALKIRLPPPQEAPRQALDAAFDDGIRLSGYSLSATAGSLRLKLFWQAARPPSKDYTVFVHLVDTAGNIAGQSDGEPLDGQYPTSIWEAGETVVDERVILVPAGEYSLSVGLYRWEDGARLPVRLDGASEPGDRVPLGPVQVP